MANYRKILVAYDGSGSAKNALALAGKLARQEKSWIKVVAVVPRYAGEIELIGVRNIKDLIDGAGGKLLADAREIARSEDIHILTDLKQGEPFEKIVSVAEEENCDLIVMGRCGRNHLERELMGSVTARVIGHTTKNVMVVPESGTLAWNTIILATDGSPFSSAAVETAITRARDNTSKLTAVSAVYANEEFQALAPAIVDELGDKAKTCLDEIRARAAAEGVEMETLVREGEPHQVITQVAGERGAEVIIMGSHGRKGFSKLLMGSVTERTIGYAQCPVLVVH